MVTKIPIYVIIAVTPFMAACSVPHVMPASAGPMPPTEASTTPAEGNDPKSVRSYVPIINHAPYPIDETPGNPSQLPRRKPIKNLYP